MTECPKCKKRPLYPHTHSCHRFEAGIPWNGAVGDCDWNEIYAGDERQAAVEYAEESDAGGDYVMIRNGEGEVWIRDEAGTITKWDISAESVPQYSANEKRATSIESPARGGT